MKLDADYANVLRYYTECGLQLLIIRIIVALVRVGLQKKGETTRLDSIGVTDRCGKRVLWDFFCNSNV